MQQNMHSMLCTSMDNTCMFCASMDNTCMLCASMDNTCMLCASMDNTCTICNCQALAHGSHSLSMGILGLTAAIETGGVPLAPHIAALKVMNMNDDKWD